MKDIGKCSVCGVAIVEYPAVMNYGGLPDPAEPNIPYSFIDDELYCEKCREEL